jgi:hypothetical protein
MSGRGREKQHPGTWARAAPRWSGRQSIIAGAGDWLSGCAARRSGRRPLALAVAITKSRRRRGARRPQVGPSRRPPSTTSAIRAAAVDSFTTRTWAASSRRLRNGGLRSGLDASTAVQTRPPSSLLDLIAEVGSIVSMMLTLRRPLRHRTVVFFARMVCPSRSRSSESRNRFRLWPTWKAPVRHSIAPTALSSVSTCATIATLRSVRVLQFFRRVIRESVRHPGRMSKVLAGDCRRTDRRGTWLRCPLRLGPD